jgi:hypothetical protein
VEADDMLAAWRRDLMMARFFSGELDGIASIFALPSPSNEAIKVKRCSL